MGLFKKEPYETMTDQEFVDEMIRVFDIRLSLEHHLAVRGYSSFLSAQDPSHTHWQMAGYRISRHSDGRNVGHWYSKTYHSASFRAFSMCQSNFLSLRTFHTVPFGNRVQIHICCSLFPSLVFSHLSGKFQMKYAWIFRFAYKNI